MCRGSGCVFEVGRQAAAVEGRQVGGIGWPSQMLEVCAGTGGRLPRLLLSIGGVMAVEACCMAALELAVGVAALVVVALEGDEEELQVAAGSGLTCTC